MKLHQPWTYRPDSCVCFSPYMVSPVELIAELANVGQQVGHLNSNPSTTDRYQCDEPTPLDPLPALAMYTLTKTSMFIVILAGKVLMNLHPSRTDTCVRFSPQMASPVALIAEMPNVGQQVGPSNRKPNTNDSYLCDEITPLNEPTAQHNWKLSMVQPIIMASLIELIAEKPNVGQHVGTTENHLLVHN